MKKSDLRSGDIVLGRDGTKYIVLKDTKLYDAKKDLIVSLTSGGYLLLSYYDENLKDKDGDDKFDIIKVCSQRYVGENIRDHILNNREQWTWEREEEKEMTVDEISEKLGYKVKVVGLK